MTKDMTIGNPAKTILFFTLPMLLGNVFQQFYNMVDAIIVGNFVGENALAAVGSSFPAVFMLVAVAMGLTTGCSVVISQYFGAGKIKETKQAIFTSLIAIFLLSLIVTVFGVLVSDYLLKLLNTPENIFILSSTYLKIYFLGITFLFMYNAFAATMRALGDSKTPLYFLILATILNVVLDYSFVVYLNLGVAGVAWATVISQAVSALLCLLYIVKFMPIMSSSKGELVFSYPMFKLMLSYGIPSTIQQLIVSLGMFFLQRLVNSYGSVVIAGYTAACKIDSFAMMPMMNFSMAISTFVGQNIGAGNIKRAKQGYHATLVLAVAISAFISLMIFLFGPQIISLFMDASTSQEAINIGVGYIKIVSSLYFIMAILFTTNGVLRGSGDMSVFTIASAFNLLVRVVFAYLFSAFFGYQAIWWAIPMGWLAGSIISLIRYRSGKWQKKGIFHSEYGIPPE
ncbi:MAG: MATE family efflux transporter [Clostridia bacterium]